MDNKEYLLKRLRQYKTEDEKSIFINQKLTSCYMNGDTRDWVTVFSCVETKYLIDIGFKKGANFEFAFTNSSEDSDKKFQHLLLWLERTKQINLVSSENVNNCLLSATLVYQDLKDPLNNTHKNLNSLYENHILKNKIDIFFADNAIFLNLSNMKNKYMIDFLIKNHYKDILSSDELHQKLINNQRHEFSSYLLKESLSCTLKNEKKIYANKIKI